MAKLALGLAAVLIGMRGGGPMTGMGFVILAYAITDIINDETREW